MNPRGTMLAILIGGILLIAPGSATPAAANADLVGALNIIDQKPPTPSVNTALVYTNTSAREVEVKMAATNSEGKNVGQHYLKIPPYGVRFVFISEFIEAANLPFVGWVQAGSSSRIHGNAVLLGLGATDLPSESRPHSRMIFPVTATY